LNAFSSGIGGGGFMVIRVPEGPYREGLEDEFKENGLVAIDFRETSPENSEKEMYGVKRSGRRAAQVGGLAVGVPGELRGLELGTCPLFGARLMDSSFVVWLATLGRGRYAGSKAGTGMAS
jgi:gamma-glutamyltranspeptidase